MSGCETDKTIFPMSFSISHLSLEELDRQDAKTPSREDAKKPYG